MDARLFYTFNGLDTGFKNVFGLNSDKNISDTLEVFLAAVKRTLLKEAFRN